MKTENFVDEQSIVRQIWGKSDTILFIFAGASAEFALNKAVDWLYFTGKLPADPLGRLFSTVGYARAIIFSEEQAASNSIKKINTIHASVENKRGDTIPAWAYRDVLFMLIDYSIRAFEILERPLTPSEKEEVLAVFTRLGFYMNIEDLPTNFSQFEIMRSSHLEQHLYYGEFSQNLYNQYRKHLGLFRYKLLLETQSLITPPEVRKFLSLRKFSMLKPLLKIYKLFKKINLDWVLKSLILPAQYKKEIKSMDHISA